MRNTNPVYAIPYFDKISNSKYICPYGTHKITESHHITMAFKISFTSSERDTGDTANKILVLHFSSFLLSVVSKEKL